MPLRLRTCLLATLVIVFCAGKAHAVDYTANLVATSAWLSSQSLTDGAILYTSTEINPYFANLAAIGWLKDPASYPRVQAWLQWYINHFNWPDRWGKYGTVYNYAVAADGTQTSMDDADSTDSYAATFLSLVWAFWQTGDATAQSFILNSIGSYRIDVVGNVLTLTQGGDGLMSAKPDNDMKYLMDQCEVWRGLRDLASLLRTAFNNAGSADWYEAKAALVLQGIETHLFDTNTNLYKPDATAASTDLTKWYPDSTALLFPVIYGVIDAPSTRATQQWAAFQQAWPGWSSRSFSDPFPWVLVAYASALMGDTTSASAYVANLETTYVNNNFPWTWYCAEAGWFMRLNALLVSKK